MDDRLTRFAGIVRRAQRYTEARSEPLGGGHPFETRNIHSRFPSSVRALFDDGHYAQSTFEAFKFIDKEVQRLAKSTESGFKLMMNAFKDAPPHLGLTPMVSATDKDEQKGYQFLFAGSILAIRNPRGHEYSIVDSPDVCLDHLGFASQLLRRLEQSGFR
jgi:uncharacterized protein (TIGR02391 family)